MRWFFLFYFIFYFLTKINFLYLKMAIVGTSWPVLQLCIFFLVEFTIMYEILFSCYGIWISIN